MSDNLVPSFPIPPYGIGDCSGCKFHEKRMREQMTMTPQGPLPVKALRQMGELVTGPKWWQAPCTLFPQWHPTPDNWWCHQWKLRDE